MRVSPVGVGGRVESDRHEHFEWLLDDRAGDGALGGVYLCGARPDPHGWHSHVDWFETLDEAGGVLDASLSWLQPSESEPIVALLPVESARLDRLTDEGRFADLLTLQSLESIAETWMRYQNTNEHNPQRLRDQWAIDLWMDDHWWEDEERLREGLLRLVHAARTEDDSA